uniref:FZ domain-containing protein n=2 Tax=Hemiselmis andersenii TaxID=464988 RepID=A0A6T8PDX0_HEMAN
MARFAWMLAGVLLLAAALAGADEQEYWGGEETELLQGGSGHHVGPGGAGGSTHPHGRKSGGVGSSKSGKASVETLTEGSRGGTHSALHKAAVDHAMHKKATQLKAGVPIKLPVIPKSPPVCSPPPVMRFCKNVDYPVYRPSEAHTFAQLDFDSHAVFNKIVPHMRISERHFELPVIQQCRDNFRVFLCERNFPRCCHVGLCNDYGQPEPALTTADLIPQAAIKRQKATTVTFVNGSKHSMKVQEGRNDTVKVKVADAVCLQYVNTYTPLFDCRNNCMQLLSKDCRFMLSQDCDNLCYGVHTEKCATPALFTIATGKDSAAGRGEPTAWLAVLAAVLVAGVVRGQR